MLYLPLLESFLRRTLSLSFFLTICISCSSDSDSEGLIEEEQQMECSIPLFIRYSNTQTYKLIYDYLGRLSKVDAGNISDENKFSEEFGQDYGLSYKGDTIFVDFLPTDTRVLTILVKNDKVSELRRIYFPSGNTNIWDFQYTPNSIRVNFNYYDYGLQNTYNWGFADYKLDDKDNVISVSKYEYDRGNPTEYYITESQVLTHDNSQNIWHGFHIPFFTQTFFPDSQYFSKNNVLTIETTRFNEDGSENWTLQESYDYTYNEQGLPIQSTSSTGDLQYFSYIGCPNWAWDDN
ncbi:hypothetical protein [Ulvibacterium sp.]|uniref:hypothetical protein n=1 Tax=Ulvibacterium sp. TaxID=2665914 RepID=UPI003BABE56A